MVEEQRKIIDRSQQMLNYRYEEVRLLRRAFFTMAKTYNDLAKTSKYQLMLALVLNQRVCYLEDLLNRNNIRYKSVGRGTMMSASSELLGANPDGSFMNEDGIYLARTPWNSVELCPNMPDEYDEDEYWRDLYEDEKAKAEGQGGPNNKNEEQKQKENKEQTEEETEADEVEKEKEEHGRGGFSVPYEDDEDDQWESDDDDSQSRSDSEDEDTGDEDEDDHQGKPKREVIDGLPRLPQASEMENADLGDSEKKESVDESDMGQGVLAMLANAVARHEATSTDDSPTSTKANADVAVHTEQSVEQSSSPEQNDQPSMTESTPVSTSTSATPPSKSTEGTSGQSSSADKSSFTADFCDTAVPIRFEAGPRKVEHPVKQSGEGEYKLPPVAAESLSSNHQQLDSLITITDSRQDETTSSLQQEQEDTTKKEAVAAGAAEKTTADAADNQGGTEAGEKIPRRKILAGMTKTQQRRQRQKWAKEKKALEEADQENQSEQTG